MKNLRLSTSPKGETEAEMTNRKGTMQIKATPASNMILITSKTLLPADSFTFFASL